MTLNRKQTNALARRVSPPPPRPRQLPKRHVRNVGMLPAVWAAVDAEARRQNRSANNLIESTLWAMFGNGEPLS